MKVVLLILMISTLITPTLGAEKAFEQTLPGTFELKTLPSGRLIVSKDNGDYFDRSNNLFMPLFRYISEKRIAMTTPVEAKIDPGEMYFWIAEDEAHKANEDGRGVEVIDVPERFVASMGARGAYTERNFEMVKRALMERLANDETLVAIGEPYAVYWNGPMTARFLKKFEVHVEVSRVE